jgi:3-phosphoshikimate 1-carboxyvinyltransferase
MAGVLRVSRSGPLVGSLRVPSDKSLTHRAYLFAAMARPGTSVVRTPLRGEDCENTLKIVRQLGASVEVGEVVTVTSSGQLRSPDSALDCGNSGTTMRLLAGVLASTPELEATLVGDASLSRRPMKRVTEPLRLMGAEIEGDTAPLTIHGKRLRGIEYASPVASAQVKSCLLLAGLNAEGETWVTEPAQSRDHTERMLASLGVPLKRKGDRTIGVSGGHRWDAFETEVPADVSSAAFFLCAVAAVPGSRVVLTDVGTNPTRTGVLEALAVSGARITAAPKDEQMGEPVSDLAIEGGDLRAFSVCGDIVPRLIDEIPVLAVLATQCSGTTTFRDADELRVKETDRIETVAQNLRAMGADVETFDDGLAVTGPTRLRGATVDAEGDHRIGMAFAVAGLIAEGETTILNAESIQTSYPGFERDLLALQGRT